MSQFIFLDSGPLGLLTHPRQTAEVTAITGWLSRILKAGQVLSFGAPANEFVIATTNAKHLAQFVAARNWEDIE